MANFPGLKKEFYIHLRLVKDYIPKLYEHLVVYCVFDRGMWGLKHQCTVRIGL